MDRQEPKLNRRYKPGQEFYYDYAYDSEINNSRVLNEDYQPGEMDGLLELKEKRLQVLELDLRNIIASQSLARQTAINKGTTWTEDDRSREKRVRIEAQIDVVRLEIEALEEAIEEAEKEKNRHDKLPVLPSGPMGLSQIRGSTGSGYLDGQWCELVNGIPVITDERPTPYRGMSAHDYLAHVAVPWIRASREYNAKRRKEDLAAGKPGDSLPRDYGYPWPKWPANVKNHLSNGKDTEEAKKVQAIAQPRMIRRK